MHTSIFICDIFIESNYAILQRECEATFSYILLCFMPQFSASTGIITIESVIYGGLVGGLCLRRALLRCVPQETAPRPGFGFPALPVPQHEILLFFLDLGFLPVPLLLTSDL